jgi:hypothetical protein
LEKRAKKVLLKGGDKGTVSMNKNRVTVIVWAMGWVFSLVGMATILTNPAASLVVLGVGGISILISTAVSLFLMPKTDRLLTCAYGISFALSQLVIRAGEPVGLLAQVVSLAYLAIGIFVCIKLWNKE